jgi:hypothetical protein
MTPSAAYSTVLGIANALYHDYGIILIVLAFLLGLLVHRSIHHRKVRELRDEVEDLQQRLGQRFYEALEETAIAEADVAPEPPASGAKKIRLTKVHGLDSVVKIGEFIIGFEESPPEPGKAYCLTTLDGKAFRTSIIVRLSQAYIHTRNSIYYIETLEPEQHAPG